MFRLDHVILYIACCKVDIHKQMKVKFILKVGFIKPRRGGRYVRTNVHTIQDDFTTKRSDLVFLIKFRIIRLYILLNLNGLDGIV